MVDSSEYFISTTNGDRKFLAASTFLAIMMFAFTGNYMDGNITSNLDSSPFLASIYC